jgi:hypothetical protein
MGDDSLANPTNRHGWALQMLDECSLLATVEPRVTSGQGSIRPSDEKPELSASRHH